MNVTNTEPERGTPASSEEYPNPQADPLRYLFGFPTGV
jgi:hypothetical protein